MKMVVGHTPYVNLVFGFLFASLAFQVRVALGSGLCVMMMMMMMIVEMLMT